LSTHTNRESTCTLDKWTYVKKIGGDKALLIETKVEALVKRVFPIETQKGSKPKQVSISKIKDQSTQS
jgi:hypothetical protein